MPPTAYPKVGSKAWRTLRARAASAPSTRFTAPTVAAALGLANAESAQNNIVRPMRALGIFDEDGGLTARGNKWRNDGTYADACDEILAEVYPADLAALTESDGSPSLSQVKRWMGHQGFGDSNASQMAATYVMIASKTIPDPPPSDGKKTPAPKLPGAKPAKIAKPARTAGKGDEKGQQGERSETGRSGPDVHLDIQIHIPADASPTQINAIFESMAKHLYGRGAE